MYPTAAKFAVTLLALVAGGAVLQDPQDPATSREFVLEPGEHTIKDLIERSSRFLGRNTLFLETDFQGAMTNLSLQKRMVLNAPECEEVVSQLLFSRGFALVPLDREKNVWEAINMQGPKRGLISNHAVTMTPAEVIRSRSKKIVVRCSVQLESLNPQMAVNQMRPFFAQGGAGQSLIVGTAGGNSLMIEGFADQVAGCLDLIQQMENPNADDSRIPDEHTLKWGKQIEARLATIEKRLEALEAHK